MPQDGIFGDIKIHSMVAEDDASAQIRLDISYPVSLKIAVAERFQVIDLGNEWTDAGVYLLVDRPSQDGSWSAYVGKSAARGGVKRRLRLHLRDLEKSSWYRAVAVCPADGGWDEAEVAFLEGHVYRALSELPAISLSNTQVPSSGRLAQSRRMRLLKVPEVLIGVLVLIGHAVAGNDNQQAPQREASQFPEVGKPFRPGKLAGLLEAGLVGLGTKLVTLDPRWPGEGIVTANGYIESAGETHSSPSGAAKAMSGRKAESGWTFWAIESAQGPTLRELRDRLESCSMTSTSPGPNQDTLPTEAAEVEKRPRKPKNKSEATVDKEHIEDKTPTVKAPRGRGVRLGDIVAAGLIPVGAKLVSISGKWPAEGRVLDDGRIEIGGNTFDSPSAAGAAVTGRGGVNGWTFWALHSPEGERLTEARERFARGT